MRTWLVDIRKTAGKSQYEAAAECGISQSYYAAIETGVRGNPLNVKIAKRIAAALGFDWKKFYEDPAETEAKEKTATPA